MRSLHKTIANPNHWTYIHPLHNDTILQVLLQSCLSQGVHIILNGVKNSLPLLSFFFKPWNPNLGRGADPTVGRAEVQQAHSKYLNEIGINKHIPKNKVCQLKYPPNGTTVFKTKTKTHIRGPNSDISSWRKDFSKTWLINLMPCWHYKLTDNLHQKEMFPSQYPTLI